MKENIEFSEFLEIEKKLEIRVGLVTEIEDVPKSNKLRKLAVDFGEEEIRIVVTNISKNIFTSEWMKDKLFLFITNLKPVTMMGIESSAMILPGEIEKELGVTVNAVSGTNVL